MDEAVRKFVDDDVVEDILREEEESSIEHNNTFCGATSPLRSCKGELYSINGDTESFPIHCAHNFFHMLHLCSCKEIPQESVEGGSAEMWSDVHDPSVLFPLEWRHLCSLLWCEEEAVGFP